MNKTIFSILYISFFISALIYQINAEKKVDAMEHEDGKKHKEWTHVLITTTFIALSFGALVEYFIFYGRTINLLLSLIGVTLFTFGIIGRNLCIKTLGKYWSGDIEIRQNHTIITTGIYSILRHPNYSCMILKAVGFSLVPNAYYTLLFSLLVYIPIILIRLYFEERELEKIGNDYLQYKRKVWALVPFKCLIYTTFHHS
jgi:protein-S-isoprenylcysteine O-methyltransferase Ste14